MLKFMFRRMNDPGVMSKITAVILMIVLIPLFISNLLNIISVSKHLKDEVFNRLITIRDAKRDEMRFFFTERYRDIEEFRRITEVRDGLINFSAAFEQGVKSASYQEVITEYEPFVEYLINQHAYYDLFLINNQGDVVYTYAREKDFGVNLFNPAYERSSLARAFHRGIERTTLIDYAYYEPSFDYASFISAPIQNKKGETLGVVALQLSDQAINDMMKNHSGLGETGDVYLVCHNRILRSDHGLKDKSRWVQEVNGDSVELAYAEQPGIKTIRNFKDDKVLVAYAPLEIEGLDWVLVTEINTKEAYAVTYALIGKILLQAGIFTFIVLMVVYLSTKKITMPLNRVIAMGERIINGNDYLPNILMIITDMDGCCIFADERATQLSGITPEEFVHDQPIGMIITEAIQRKAVIKKIEQITIDDTKKFIDISAFPIQVNDRILGGVAVGIDITEKIQLKHKLIDSERIFIMGEMTGRIMHDIRNLLQLSKLSVQMLEHYNQKDCLSKEKIHESLITIDNTLNNVTELLNDLLQFAKPETSKSVELHLKEFVDQQLKIFQSTFQKNRIECDVDIVEDLTIVADPKLIRQAILNLIQNAIDVLQNHDGRRLLKIEGRHQQKRILLEFYNTGPIIPTDYQDQIFKAFFTTKGSSGTGLGLATTKEIIEDVYGGKIWFTSCEEIKGTVFFIQLPDSFNDEAVS